MRRMPFLTGSRVRYLEILEGLGSKPPAQFGHTLFNTVSTQSLQ
jgi:hypothetical protein